MKTYKPGQLIEVTIPFKNEMGDIVTPTALSYTVYDEVGNTIAGPTSPAFTASNGEVTIAISAVNNTLPVGDVIGYRKVDLTITVGSVSFINSEDYVLKSSTVLVRGTNSVQTYEQAIMTSMEMGDLDGWNKASDDERKVALLAAYDALGSLTYTIMYTDDTEELLSIKDLELADYTLVEPTQLRDFRKAQVAQANYILGGNPTEKKIADGLQSSTIGEVSQFFRPRPSLSLALCRSALNYIGKYVSWSAVVARA
jgi:hypothetical protein